MNDTTYQSAMKHCDSAAAKLLYLKVLSAVCGQVAWYTNESKLSAVSGSG